MESGGSTKLLCVMRDPVGNNNNSIANCTVCLAKKKVINLKMAHS